MRQFIDQRDAWLAPQHGLRVHLLKCFTAVFDLEMRQGLDPLGLSDRVGTRMRLKVSNDDIDSSLRSGVAIRKHLEGLSDARSIAQVNLQATAWSVRRSRHRGN